MSTWTGTGSWGHLKGYLTRLKNPLCRLVWRERMSLLKWRTGPPWVHLSRGGLVSTCYVEGWRVVWFSSKLLEFKFMDSKSKYCIIGSFSSSGAALSEYKVLVKIKHLIELITISRLLRFLPAFLSCKLSLCKGGSTFLGMYVRHGPPSAGPTPYWWLSPKGTPLWYGGYTPEGEEGN